MKQNYGVQNEVCSRNGKSPGNALFPWHCFVWTQGIGESRFACRPTPSLSAHYGNNEVLSEIRRFQKYQDEWCFPAVQTRA